MVIECSGEVVADKHSKTLLVFISVSSGNIVATEIEDDPNSNYSANHSENGSTTTYKCMNIEKGFTPSVALNGEQSVKLEH